MIVWTLQGAYDASCSNQGPLALDTIAESLAKTCRYNGHCRGFYSVAEHSVYVSRLAGRHSHAAAMVGLLHDAGEVIAGDLLRPLREIAPELGMFEGTVLQQVLVDYGLIDSFTAEVWEQVKEADEEVGNAEAAFLLNGDPPWARKSQNVVGIHGFEWRHAQKFFLAEAAELGIRCPR